MRASLAALVFFLLQPASSQAQPPAESTVFTSGKDGYHTFRIPAVVVTKKGTVLAFCEGRKDGRSDTGNIDLVLKRSFDGGTTWRPMQVVADDGANTSAIPAPSSTRDRHHLAAPDATTSAATRRSQIELGTSKGRAPSG